MQSQLRLSYTVGLPQFRPNTTEDQDIATFKRRVAETACWLVGGCTTRSDIGFWVCGAEQEQSHYTGAMSPEEAWTIEVCVDYQNFEWVHERMRMSIVDNAVQFEVATNWVHVTSEPVNIAHFSIDEERRK